jgi:glycine cleavage system H lipoate-binding protein
MSKLSKLAKVSESISINRYDNGWMVEIGGRDEDDEWKNTKTLCNTEDEIVALVKEWNSKKLDD